MTQPPVPLPPIGKVSPPPIKAPPAQPPVQPAVEAAVPQVTESPAPQVTAQVVPKTLVKMKGSKDATAAVLSKLKRSKPRESDDPTKPQAAFSRSVDVVMSSVKYVITTGIPSFDQATGGIPFCKVTEIYGLDSCGKTALSFLLCGRAKAGHVYEYVNGKFKPLEEEFEVTIVYLDNENSLEQGERMMVQGKEVDAVIGECDTIDQIFKTVEDAAAAIKEVEEKTKIKQFLVVVADTIAGTSTEAEKKKAWGTTDYARQPKQLRDGFRAVIRDLKEANVCFICTNQVSDSFKPKMPGMKAPVSSVPQESDYSSFGGKALRYYAWTRIFMAKLPNTYKLSKTHRFSDGHHIEFFTSKNRHRMPLRKGRMVLLFSNAMCDHVKPEHRDWSSEELKTVYPGGYSPVYSILEHLVFMKFANYGSTGGYRLFFEKHGVKINVNPASLQEQDDQEDSGYLDVESRAAWPAFYLAHKEAVDALFEKCVESMFKQDIAGQEDEAAGFEGELDEELPQEE